MKYYIIIFWHKYLNFFLGLKEQQELNNDDKSRKYKGMKYHRFAYSALSGIAGF